MNATEMLMRRRVVKAFIDADSVKVIVTRKTGTMKTEAGGYISKPDKVLEPQTARIILNKRRYTAGIVNAEAGDIPHTDYLLIAEHLKDFQPEDEFTWLGEHYKITGIYKARTESILAAIDILGETNRG